MKSTYIDLIQQNYDFPQAGFDLHEDYLTFNDIDIKQLIQKYGTPFKLTYLPKISQQIQAMQQLFAQALQKYAYQGQYYFCYCTKCNHFYPIVEEALQQAIHLETSSAFDIDLIQQLYAKGNIDKDITLLHNGYKTTPYLQKINELRQQGYTNSIIILDSTQELRRLEQTLEEPTNPIKIGLRMATNQDAKSSYFTSRLGIPAKDIVPFFEQEIKHNAKVELQMLHFFVDSGIKKSLYYWQEFERALELYVALKKQSPHLTAFNIGGGFPIQNHLNFEYDYAYMVDEMVRRIQEACTKENIPVPDIFTEFGKYTVGEAGAIIFEVLEQKQQNDVEHWYIINNSLLNTIPDAWSIHKQFILLPINKWKQPYQRVNIGGISCDQADYYNSEDFNQEVLLPSYHQQDQEPLYLGFFHTGAYQDAISGYGGVKHCLIPSPKHILITKNAEGKLVDALYKAEESVEDMFKILGYT
ncbi:MAG: arginine decarboxylase [Aureispira sp.]